MALDPVENFSTMSLLKASELTKNWQEENYLKAFLFHKNDLECLAQQTSVVGVRFYVGITQNEAEAYIPDMIVVGVNAENQDVIVTDQTESEILVSGIYDFALPCPELCDPDSLLFHRNIVLSEHTMSSSPKTVQHSTDDECNIALGTISVETAVERVSIWQCTMNKTLVSLFFNIEDLDAILREYTGANALRVYFGLENETEHRVIVIGAQNSETNPAYYEDIQTKLVYVNTSAPCTGNGEFSCASNRILYRTCNES
ncbi:MAG: hypothetical protein AAF617_02135 [Bacteroidota bacterium]